MDYGTAQSQFATILNRRDLTPSQTTIFMGMAIQRIQRDLRVPAMEKLVNYTMDSTGIIPVPGDFLEMISVSFETQAFARKLIRTDLQTAMRLNLRQGIPTSYYRQAGNLIVGPVPEAGAVALIHYYADASGLAATTDHNWLTDAAPDLLIYAALSFAADNFLDERAQAFESRYQSIAQSLNDMANADELENASISPAYSSNHHHDSCFH